MKENPFFSAIVAIEDNGTKPPSGNGSLA